VIGTTAPQRPLHRQQPPSHPQASSPAVMPQFPSVPTAAPEPTYSMHASTIPSGFEQKEGRKEALLIDL
jgi:growth factor-regulated tyrosine kinase substrate